jgi:hypothetical protein
MRHTAKPSVLGIRIRSRGSLTVRNTKNGPKNQMVQYGCMEFVRLFPIPLLLHLTDNIPAGAGKTILTSVIIEEAKILVEQNPKCALAYYYCEYRLPETQLLSNILGSLIRQICATSDEVFEELDLFYSDRNEKAKHPVLPTAEELDKLLWRLSTSFESVMIIVDGLDEISDPEELSKVLSTLSSLTSPTDGSIKVIYTSRDEIDIKRHLPEFETICIAARGKDLELFVAAVVEDRIRNRSLRLRDPTLKGIIIDGIVSKANGMFQWAKCQLDYLCLLNNDKERRNALDTLPKDLFETYRRILNRVNNSTPGNRSLVQRTLRWILFSLEPMNAEAVAMAVAVKVNSAYVRYSLSNLDLPNLLCI